MTDEINMQLQRSIKRIITFPAVKFCACNSLLHIFRYTLAGLFNLTGTHFYVRTFFHLFLCIWYFVDQISVTVFLTRLFFFYAGFSL